MAKFSDSRGHLAIRILGGILEYLHLAIPGGNPHQGTNITCFRLKTVESWNN